MVKGLEDAFFMHFSSLPLWAFTLYLQFFLFCLACLSLSYLVKKHAKYFFCQNLFHVINNRNPKVKGIPHICHFFYTGRNFERQYFTHKNYEKQITPKMVNYVFFAFNLENFTPDRIFLHRHRLWCLWQIWGMDVTTRRRSRI